jgi:hypothetical protein
MNKFLAEASQESWSSTRSVENRYFFKYLKTKIEIIVKILGLTKKELSILAEKSSTSTGRVKIDCGES